MRATRFGIFTYSTYAMVLWVSSAAFAYHATTKVSTSSSERSYGTSDMPTTGTEFKIYKLGLCLNRYLGTDARLISNVGNFTLAGEHLHTKLLFVERNTKRLYCLSGGKVHVFDYTKGSLAKDRNGNGLEWYRMRIPLIAEAISINAVDGKLQLSTPQSESEYGRRGKFILMTDDSVRQEELPLLDSEKVNESALAVGERLEREMQKELEKEQRKALKRWDEYRQNFSKLLDRREARMSPEDLGRRDSLFESMNEPTSTLKRISDTRFVCKRWNDEKFFTWDLTPVHDRIR